MVLCHTIVNLAHKGHENAGLMQYQIGHALIGHKGYLYVTLSIILGAVLTSNKIGLLMTNSNNYSFGNHFFKVLVQIPYSHLARQIASIFI